MSDLSASTDELVAELKRYESQVGGDAPTPATDPQPAPRKSLREELDELACGPFDLARERRKLAVAAAIAAGAE